MPIHSFVVLLAFSVSGMVLLVRAIRLRQSGADLLGVPTIEAFDFYSGKIAIFTSWGLFILKAIFPSLGYVFVPDFLSWIATGMLWLGTLSISMAFLDLGRSLKVGLPTGETKLMTGGVYRISRNPIYTSVHLIAIASCLYFPDLINISFTLYGIVFHHKIIRSEELFLAKRFGKEWETYRERVRRYI